MSDGEGRPAVRIVAIVLGLLILAGTILLVVAGASGGHGRSNVMGPLAFLLCIVAVAVMIVLGVTFGGRNNPRRAPHSQAANIQTAKIQTAKIQTGSTQVPGTANDGDEPGDQA
jgi:ABC-type dipeptide/oligopeptide/nickel transport system permease subunit